MIIRELTKEEIEHCNTLITTGEKKDFIQHLTVNEFAKYKKLIVNFTTGTGKTLCVVKAIKRMQTKFGTELPYVVLVPTTVLKQEFESLLQDYENVYVFIINTYVKNKIFDKIQALFVDESHRILNEFSQSFSKALTQAECQYQMLLTATLDNAQLDFAKQNGFNYRFVIDNTTALKLQLIPEYKTYNLYIDLLPYEQKKYNEIEATYKDYITMFSVCQEKGTGYYIASCLKDSKKLKEAANILNLTEGQVLGSCKKWFWNMNQRKQILHKSKAKYEILEQILEKIKFRQTLVYVSTQKEAEEISKKSHLRAAYYGNKSQKILEDFTKEKIHTIISVAKLIEGQVSDNVEFVIRLNFNTKERIYIQSSGRSKRFDKNNPDKVGITINLVIKNSQDETWIKAQTKNERFLYHVDKIEQITELYEEI